jgi:hypothetical protein
VRSVIVLDEIRVQQMVRGDGGLSYTIVRPDGSVDLMSPQIPLPQPVPAVRRVKDAADQGAETSRSQRAC